VLDADITLTPAGDSSALMRVDATSPAAAGMPAVAHEYARLLLPPMRASTALRIVSGFVHIILKLVKRLHGQAGHAGLGCVAVGLKVVPDVGA
jgi:hypothetical protein